MDDFKKSDIKEYRKNGKLIARYAMTADYPEVLWLHMEDPEAETEQEDLALRGIEDIEKKLFSSVAYLNV